jgi:hypothetical protein
MQPFVKATVEEAELQQIIGELKKKFPDKGDAEEIVRKEFADCIVFSNDTYQVQVRKTKWPKAPDGSEFMDMFWLSIKRLDREPIHDWRDLQTIKNMIVGEHHEGIEIYPAEDRLVDTSNQYHLWVFADPEFRLPIGFDERCVTDVVVGKSKQRPFGEQAPVRVRVPRKMKKRAIRRKPR